MEPLAEYRVPDSPVPLEGFRVWGVVETSGGPRLVSPTPGFLATRTPVWPAYEPFAASCLARRPCGQPPDLGHLCGIHAFERLRDAESWSRDIGRSRPVVIGRVRGWGRVITHASGWRAEFAYPSGFESVYRGRLVRRDVSCLNSLAAAYGVAVAVPV